jgi:hypothetical protein
MCKVEAKTELRAMSRISPVRYMILAMLGVCFMLMYPRPSFGGDIMVVDSIGDVGKYTSMGTGWCSPAVSYYDVTNGDLKCLVNGTPERVDSLGNVGMFTSLAVELPIPKDLIHIGYYDSTNGNLKYAHRDSSGWNIRNIDTAGNVGMYTSLELDRLNHPHISYYNATNGNLKYAYRDSIGWHIETIDMTGDVGRYSALGLDTLDYPHIGYYDATNGDLKYAHWNGSDWCIQHIDTLGDVGKYVSLLFWSEGWGDAAIYVAYYDSTNGDLKSASWYEEEWHIRRVDSTDDVGKWCSLPSGPYIHDCSGPSYYDATNKDLKFWGRVQDGAGDVGAYSSLCIPGDYYEIVYYDATHGDLKYTWGGGAVEEISDNGRPSARLCSNHPNPITQSTRIDYETVRDCDVSVRIYDVTGQLVTILVGQWQARGKHAIVWNPTGLSGGIYFCRLQAGHDVATEKMTLLCH